MYFLKENQQKSKNLPGQLEMSAGYGKQCCSLESSQLSICFPTYVPCFCICSQMARRNEAPALAFRLASMPQGKPTMSTLHEVFSFKAAIRPYEDQVVRKPKLAFYMLGARIKHASP